MKNKFIIEKNDIDALYNYYGTSLRDYGAELELNIDGSIKVYLGSWG